jgi:DNA repair exonuclease SbcCD ATPase subunit
MRILWLVALLKVALGSPVQKVVEMLGECKAKVEKDLEEEKTAMQEFTAYCDDGAKEKAYAIETAAGGIEELSAKIEDSKATVATSDDEIADLGTAISKKENELSAATAVRKKEHGNFVAAEKELVESVDQLGRALQVLKKGASFSQMRGKGLSKRTYAAISALKTIVESQWVSSGSRKHLQSFLQAAENAAEDDDLSMEQPQAKQVGYESSSGGIITTVEEMQGKAEDTLSQLRKKEMEESQAFEMLKSGLEGELSHDKEKLGTATKTKAAATEAAEGASGELVATQKTKAADEAFLSSLKHECQERAVEFEQSMKEGKDEIAAITKATEILEEGVTALVETSSKVHKFNPNDDDDESEADDQKREQLAKIFKSLLRKRHSFVLTQLVTMAGSDPFEKIKGLITEMIDKLVKEAQEAATHEAFCQEELGKTKKAQDDKTMKLDKYTTRVDEGVSKIAELKESIKDLESEVADIDKTQAEATTLRTKETEEYSRASKDFKDSANAVAQAIEVLQSFYGGASLIQVTSHTKVLSKARSKSEDAEGKQGDAANAIISILEVAQEDFTSLLAEVQATEDEAAKAYDKLTTENKISKASKVAEAKGKNSELKSVSSAVEMAKEDQSATSQELDAVLAYFDKLKPECESKAMSYEEKKAAREAEIEGLKEALSILSGSAALVQTGRHLRRVAPHV